MPATHSPKAGQGMNVSMADAFNLGWKLASVVKGQARHELLETYSTERHAKAQELIDFDREMAKILASNPTTPDEAAHFQQYFQKHGRYTAGVETRYGPSLITGTEKHQMLATGLLVGKRFHSAPVIRLADAKPLQLGHALKADGRWRLFAFADCVDRGNAGGKTALLCDFLKCCSDSPLRLYTPPNADADAVIDVRAIYQHGHRDMGFNGCPELLRPVKGDLSLIDYEKIFCADINSRMDIFELRGIDRNRGALLIIRPDQFVAQVLPLDDFKSLCHFFAGFMIACD